jgi:hypothetical protein
MSFRISHVYIRFCIFKEKKQPIGIFPISRTEQKLLQAVSRTDLKLTGY